MLANKLIHGGDYNPEQWLEYPEILEEDIRLMQKAGVNCATVGIFSWSMLEPEEGVYDFSWLEKVIDRLWEAGIYVVLATPSGAMPQWLTQKYPEVMQVGAARVRNLPGRRHNFCYTSPVMREKVGRLDEELAKRFGRHPAVILWHISNEMGGNEADSACHCELCQREFRRWLQKRYGTLEKLNLAWWNRFWSHVYTDWDQIMSPAPNGEYRSPALTLEWKRFVSERMSDFAAWEKAAVRKYSDAPVTTNFMEFFPGLDYHRLGRELDMISYDSYPSWHTQKDEVGVAIRAAAGYHLMRSIKKQPFFLMESTPSCTNWKPVNPQKRPGMHMLSSMQAVACGADSVQYFQWRKSRGAFEQFHGAVVGHRNGENTRTFREVAKVGERLSNLSAAVRDTLNRPKAAIVFDWDNWWIVEGITGPRLDMDYVGAVLRHYRPFWENGIDVDFISMEDDLDGYALVSAPLNYMYKDGYAGKVTEYIKNGGCYVTTYFSGIADKINLCFLGKHPLEEALGLVPEEIDAPYTGEADGGISGDGGVADGASGNGGVADGGGSSGDGSVADSASGDGSVADSASGDGGVADGGASGIGILYGGKRYKAGRLCEVVHPYTETKVLATYDSDYYEGFAAAAEHKYGKGRSFYLAAEADDAFLKEFYGHCLAAAGLENPFGVSLPYGVTVSVREGEKRLLFVMNFRKGPVALSGIGRWHNAETNELYDGELSLAGFECKVLAE